MTKTTYEIITNHQKLIDAYNILNSIENPTSNVIQARIEVENELQDSWQAIRNLEDAERDFQTAIH